MRIAVLVLVCALVVVYSKHLNRQWFIELGTLMHEQDQLQIEWGRLLLEHSTLTAHPRIEQIAREQLQMELGTESKMVRVQHEP